MCVFSLKLFSPNFFLFPCWSYKDISPSGNSVQIQQAQETDSSQLNQKVSLEEGRWEARRLDLEPKSISWLVLFGCSPPPVVSFEPFTKWLHVRVPSSLSPYEDAALVETQRSYHEISNCISANKLCTKNRMCAWLVILCSFLCKIFIRTRNNEPSTNFWTFCAVVQSLIASSEFLLRFMSLNQNQFICRLLTLTFLPTVSTGFHDATLYII